MKFFLLSLALATGPVHAAIAVVEDTIFCPDTVMAQSSLAIRVRTTATWWYLSVKDYQGEAEGRISTGLDKDTIRVNIGNYPESFKWVSIELGNKNPTTQKFERITTLKASCQMVLVQRPPVSIHVQTPRKITHGGVWSRFRARVDGRMSR